MRRQLTIIMILILAVVCIDRNTTGRPGQQKVVGGMEFVWLNGGAFIMGSDEGDLDEKPKHKVYVSGFWIGKYEVTQKQYQAIMGSNPSKFKGDNRPVERVSWNDAREFCIKFSKKYNVKARLPFEAEWEYACRAGSKTKYYWGDKIDGTYCWYDDNYGGVTHPVGQKKPNKWGLYDMSGNVHEWCMDWFNWNYYNYSRFKNPKGPYIGICRVLRGGSWFPTRFYDVRSANRFRNYPFNGDRYLGFRVVVISSLITVQPLQRLNCITNEHM